MNNQTGAAENLNRAYNPYPIPATAAGFQSTYSQPQQMEVPPAQHAVNRLADEVKMADAMAVALDQILARISGPRPMGPECKSLASGVGAGLLGQFANLTDELADSHSRINSAILALQATLG